MNRLLLIFLTLGIACLAQAAEPRRDLGVSLHMLPDRVAKISGSTGGFSLSSVDGKRPDIQKVFPTAADLIAFYEKQNKQARENGIWIVYTNLDSYSEPEMKQLEEAKTLAVKKGIPLFTCRASELPNGWKKAGE